MNFYIFAWVALILYSIAEIFEKLTLKHLIKNPWFFNFLQNFLTLVFLVVILAFKGFGAVYDWGNILYAAAFWTLGNILFFLALYHVDVSVLSPSFNLKAAFALILGIIFLGEQISLNQWGMIAVIFASSVFVSYDNDLKLRSFWTKGMLFVVMLMIVLAVNNLFVNKALQSTDFWTVTFWIQLLSTAALLFTFPLFKKELQAVSGKQIAVTAFITILTTLGLITSIRSLTGNIGIPNVIISIPFSMVLAAGISFFAPNLLERHSTKVYAIRFLAGAIMFAAAIKLTF